MPFGQLLGERRKISTGTTIRSRMPKVIARRDRGIGAQMYHSFIVYLQKNKTVNATLEVCGKDEGGLLMHKKSAGNRSKDNNKGLVTGSTGKGKVKRVVIDDALPPSQLQEMLIVLGRDDNPELMQWLYQNCIVA